MKAEKRKLSELERKYRVEADRPISGAYPEIDTDLARDNLENDLPAADLEDI